MIPLYQDKKTVLNEIKSYHLTLDTVSLELRDDPEVILVAIRHDTQALKYASERLRNDKHIVLASLSMYPHSLEHASSKLKDDLEIVIQALYYTRWNMEFISERLLEHPSIKFVLGCPSLCDSTDWPLLQRALIEQPDRFFNPPVIIRELVAHLPDKYLIYARHALYDSVQENNVELPIFE